MAMKQFVIGGVFSLAFAVSGTAAEKGDQLSSAEIGALLQPGAVWCYEPLGRTCDFMATITGFDGKTAHYEVLAKLTPDAYIKHYLTGRLDGDGLICEMEADYLDDVEVLDLNGDPYSEMVQEDVRTSLKMDSAMRGVTEHCFAYYEGSSRTVIQTHYEDGTLAADELVMFVDPRDDAADKYRVRDPFEFPAITVDFRPATTTKFGLPAANRV